MLLSRREREIRRARAGIAVAARWRPVGAWGRRGARGAGQRGGATAASKVGVTRGEEGSRRWTAATMAERRPGGSSTPAAEQGKQRCRRGSEEEEKREKVRRTSLEILESSWASQ
jgi:hypothetical protein